ncbi:MAG: hypothetical protein O7G85_12830, partial [Planctomycetota bacterium]|nr:hypothetical protein [Planctomycetota bacterium]
EGRVLYHEVGCVACHGPLELASEVFGIDSEGESKPARFYRPLDRIKGKTSLSMLTSYLQDPLSIHPDGRMPSMQLTRREALAIAFYVQEFHGASTSYESLETDPKRVERGRERFAVHGCANCHGTNLDPMGVVAKESIPARPNGSETGSEWKGCLAQRPPERSPDYDLLDMQRNQLLAFLASLPERRNEHVPLDALALTMSRLNCQACHAFQTASGPEPAIEAYFRHTAQVEVGFEGTMPPDLSAVGARLKPQWMKQVLENGAKIRPFMTTRMPQFGTANVHDLPAQFASGAGVSLEPIDEHIKPDLEALEIGEMLLGKQGFNCSLCHSFRGKPGQTFPGPDLAQATQRVRYDWFARWLRDPQWMRPGTRMVKFFYGGKSGFTQHYEGKANPQIEAVWAYLHKIAQESKPPGVDQNSN